MKLPAPAGRALLGAVLLMGLMSQRPMLPTVSKMERADVLQQLGSLTQDESDAQAQIPVLREVRGRCAADPASRFLVEHRLALDFMLLGQADSAFNCLLLASRMGPAAGREYPLEMAQVLERISQFYWAQGAYDTAERYDRAAITILEGARVDVRKRKAVEMVDGQQVIPGVQLARLYTHAGLAPARRSQLTTALHAYDQGLHLYQLQQRLAGIMWAQELRGQAFEQMGQAGEATKAYELAWKAAHDCMKSAPEQAPPLYAEVLRYWHESLFQQNQTARLHELAEEALEATDAALAETEAQGAPQPELLAAAASLHLIEAETFLTEGQTQPAKASLSQADRALTRLNRATPPEARQMLGYYEARALYQTLRAGDSHAARPPKALLTALSAIEDPVAQVAGRLRVARTLVRLHAFAPATALLDQIVAESDQILDLTGRRDAYRLLAQAHASLNHFDKAYAFGQRDQSLTDTLSAARQSDALAVAQARARQLAEVHAREEQIANQRRNRTIGLSAALVLVLGGFGFWLRYRKEAQQWLADYRARRAQAVPMVNPVAPDDIFFGEGGAVDRITPDGPRPRILVVEDNADLRAFLRHILTAHYTVLEADNGAKALSLLVRERVDLIATDEDLTGMSGAAVLQHLKAQPAWRSVPFILLTAHTHTVPQLNELEVGVDDYLPKPFLARELLARVRTLLTNYRERLSFAAAVAAAEMAENMAEGAPLMAGEGAEAIEILLRQLREAAEPLLANPDFGPAQLAARASLSETTLYRRLKEFTGLTPGGYLRTLRLERARRLLERRACLTVAEAAHATGFNDAHHLGQNFFQHFGRKPSEYLRPNG